MNQISWKRCQAIACITGAVLLMLALTTAHPDDLPFDSSNPRLHPANAIGLVGAYVSWSLLFTIGHASWWLALLLLLWGAANWAEHAGSGFWPKTIGVVFFLISVSVLFGLSGLQDPLLAFHRGGLVGFTLAGLASAYFGMWGSVIISLSIGALALLVATDFLVLPFVKRIPGILAAGTQWLTQRLESLRTSPPSPRRAAKSSSRQAADKNTAQEDEESSVEAEEEYVPPIVLTQAQKRRAAQSSTDDNAVADAPEDAESDWEDEEGAVAGEEYDEASGDDELDDEEQEGEEDDTEDEPGETADDEESDEDEDVSDEELAGSAIAPGSGEPGPSSNAKGSADRPRSTRVWKHYQLPQVDLLHEPEHDEDELLEEDLQLNARMLEEALADYGIEARVKEVEQGPVITRYELQPAPGVKVNRIVSLSDDIALVMKAASIRIVAPIPGKARVGIEIPNHRTMMVCLREVVEHDAFRKTKYPLPLALGKDVAGEPLIDNLADMPHLLIAGTTGSGKTVCVNSIIMSLLYHATPEQVQMLLIDPKMVELACYNDLPHLVHPVVTDVRKASSALNWAVNEMEERYRLLARVGVRNIEGFNEWMRKQQRLKRMRKRSALKPARGTTDEAPLPDKPLTYLVVVIDELADLMMVSAKEVEDSIIRLAQLARAVGIHLVIATQRPSVDVITGLIKANFPARISFKVASKVDSRTVLDAMGAEKLLGRGDMLFLRTGSAKPIRAQSSLVRDDEINQVVAFAKQQWTPQYHQKLKDALTKDPNREHLDIQDEKYEAAVEVVLSTGQASTSMLQRKLRLSYVRAARLMDMMEQEGIVGPARGAKPREILVDTRPKVPVD